MSRSTMIIVGDKRLKNRRVVMTCQTTVTVELPVGEDIQISEDEIKAIAASATSGQSVASCGRNATARRPRMTSKSSKTRPSSHPRGRHATSDPHPEATASTSTDQTASEVVMAAPIFIPGKMLTTTCGRVVYIVSAVECGSSVTVYVREATYQDTQTWAAPEQEVIEELINEPKACRDRRPITYPVRGEALGPNVARRGRRGLVMELAQLASTYG